MSTCVCTPRKPKLYVDMADASSTFTAVRPVVFVEKILVCGINQMTSTLPQIKQNPYFMHVKKENFHGYTFISQVPNPSLRVFQSILNINFS